MKENDRTKKRFHVKRLSLIRISEIVKLQNDNPIAKKYSYKVLKKIIRSYNSAIVDEVVKRKDGIELPENLGRIFAGVVEREDNRNYKLSEELNMKVSHRNWESDGFLLKIYYLPVIRGFKHSELYGLNPGREIQTTVSHNFSTNWKRYRVFVRDRKIRATIIKEDILAKARNIEKEILKYYDEFKF